MSHTRTNITKAKRDNFCQSCRKQFSKKEHLTRHLRSHTREKPFSCPECGKVFGRNDTLTRHIRTHRPSDVYPIPMAPASSETNLRSARPSFGNGVQAIPVSPKSQPEFQDRSQPIVPAQSTIPYENFSPTNAIAPELATEHSMMDSSPSQASFSPTSMNRLFDDIFGNATFESEISMWMNSEDLGTSSNLHTFDSSESLMSFQLPDGMIGSDATDVHHYRRADGNLATLPKEDLLRQKWFSFVGVQSTGYSTPEYGAERTPDQSLPSADFLNLCLQMFLTRFNPIFPIIHVPTFRLSSNKPLLHMAMCTLGSLFLGSPQAKNMGQRMFDRLHKASLASWEKYVSRGPDTALMVIQAALLGHTYAILSGKPSNLLTMQSFHGTIIAWARRCGMFEQSKNAATDLYVGSQDLESKWKSWAKREERSRATAAIYIQDSEYSTLFTEDPLLRHASFEYPSLCSNNSWEANTDQEWIMTTPNSHSGVTAAERPLSMDQSYFPYSSQGADERGVFGAYAKLESISASISGAKGLGTWVTMSAHLEKALLDFQVNHPQLFESPGHDQFSLEILWHSAFIQLSADMDHLEICSGRDGFEKSHLHCEYARN
ncbi:uncharacterized protein N7511_008411 [Penicillium nucicola]|uniref:uncharacterized protein n=1 Tax=Penicillium nucicola TaxID=1850975 RepID=UPI0025459270|nr:uncharacterized protein N7511_008411 [Penicillium nucicola]KAJ5751446.1 hypothetical protein N7511_008411 [Penicillium nucicola]